ELHLIASVFRRHGHDRDHAYSRVILHLVYRADTGATTPLPGGRQAPVVALETWLSSRAAEIEAMLEQPALWREPCQTAVERMGDAGVEATLVRLGERRLRAKAAAIAHREPPAALYDAMLRILGHGPQRASWIELGRRIPVSTVDALAALGPEQSTLSLEALFLAGAGLLPAPDIAAVRDDGSYLTDAWQRWRAHGSPRPAPFVSSRPSRPANHPARRLAGLARLLCRGCQPLLGRARAALLTERAPAQALQQLLAVDTEGIWSERLLPWANPIKSPPALIGRGKAIELALNAVLPVLLAEADRDARPLLVEAVLRAFRALPAPQAYGRTAHLSRALRTDGASLIRGADHSQGALHLYAHYCTRGGCGRCPLS
ncbi:MAG TPA: DUF2851 family protein, partial [Dehalococcoidia bacterium]|nr:DUF2851 family protein [Dehalococcoidia bacterium]